MAAHLMYIKPEDDEASDSPLASNESSSPHPFQTNFKRRVVFRRSVDRITTGGDHARSLGRTNAHDRTGRGAGGRGARGGYLWLGLTRHHSP